MSPKLKRIFAIISFCCTILLTILFASLTFADGDYFYLFFLIPLLIQLYLSFDYIKDLSYKIKLNADIERENHYLTADHAVRRFAETTDEVTWSTTPPMRNIEEEQDIADLLRSQNTNRNQNYRG